MSTLFYAARPILADMLSTLLFAGLFAATGSLPLSVGAGVAIGLGQLVWQAWRRAPIPALQWASLGLVVVLGGASLITGDPRLVMIKPTVIYLTVGAAMLQRDWLHRYMPPIAVERVPAGLIIGFGYAWAALMIATSLANLVIAFTLGQRAWAAFIAVFPLASKLTLFAATYLAFRLAARRRLVAAVEPAAA